MFKNIKSKIFPTLIALTALSISLSAALFSIIGLSQLFAGIGIAVIVMASSLEIAKLVIASVLYQYRKTLDKMLKVYLTIALIVLMIITSAGIYGYLSQGYSSTSNKMAVVEQQISFIESKKKIYESTKQELINEKSQLDKSSNELRTALSTGTILQSRDKNGNLITRESKSNRKAYQDELKNLSSLSQNNGNKIKQINDSIFTCENQILILKTKSTQSGELGPLKYLSKLTGQSMDKIINWLILIIIFVFDPLAISLVIAANFAFEKSSKQKLPPPSEYKDYDFPNGMPFKKYETNQEEPIPQLDVIQQKINGLKQLLENQPSLSTLKRFKIEQEIQELEKQLNDPFHKILNNTKTY